MAAKPALSPTRSRPDCFRPLAAAGSGDQISPVLFGTARHGEIVNIHAHWTDMDGALVARPHRVSQFGGGVARIGDVIIEERNV